MMDTILRCSTTSGLNSHLNERAKHRRSSCSSPKRSPLERLLMASCNLGSKGRASRWASPKIFCFAFFLFFWLIIFCKKAVYILWLLEAGISNLILKTMSTTNPNEIVNTRPSKLVHQHKLTLQLPCCSDCSLQYTYLLSMFRFVFPSL